MSSLESPPVCPGSTLKTPGYEVSLEMSATAARLTLIRASNDSAADAPAGIIAFAAELPDDIEVDARQVTSVQPDCLESLIAAARERAQHGSPGLCW